jgi:hypothetical protein
MPQAGLLPVGTLDLGLELLPGSLPFGLPGKCCHRFLGIFFISGRDPRTQWGYVVSQTVTGTSHVDPVDHFPMGSLVVN